MLTTLSTVGYSAVVAVLTYAATPLSYAATEAEIKEKGSDGLLAVLGIFVDIITSDGGLIVTAAIFGGLLFKYWGKIFG